MRAHETEGAETAPEPTRFEDMEIEDWEVKLYQAVVRREKKGSGHPDAGALRAMQEPFRQLIGACALSENFTANLRPGDDIRPLGMQFLSDAILLQAERLFRLYHGHGPGFD